MSRTFLWLTAGCLRVAELGTIVRPDTAYKICLHCCPEDSKRILSNLAAVYVKLEQWHRALACTQTVLRSEPGHFKCLYRAGVANIYLERYKSAVACLQEAFQQVTVK